MIRAALVAIALAATALAAGLPAGAAEVRVGAQATILDPTMLRLIWPAAMPSVTGEIDGARFVGRIPSMGMANMMPANARLVIRREDLTGGVVTAPAGFEVVSAGRGQGLIVRTSLDPDALGPAPLPPLDGVIVGGDLPGGSAASIDVGLGPTVASADTLMVVVQYN